MKPIDVVTEFHNVGPCVVDIPLLVKMWDWKWRIGQYKNEYRLHKIKTYRKKEINGYQLRVTISEEQAIELIHSCNLEYMKCSVFRHGGTWRK